MPELHSRFIRDKEFLLEGVEACLRGENVATDLDPFDPKNLDNPNYFGEYLFHLEIEIDKRNGIESKLIKSRDCTPTLVRNAFNRNPKARIIRGSEASLKQFVNLVAATIDVLEIDKNIPAEILKKIDLELKVKIASFAADIAGISSQAKLESKVHEAKKSLVLFLKNRGVADAEKKLDYAKDYQSFKYTNHNVATISQVSGHAVVEAEIAFKGFTEEQERQFIDLRDGKTVISEFESCLMAKHSAAILDGRHVIPARKHSLPGASIFEKVTLVTKSSEQIARERVISPETRVLEEVLTNFHSATLASLCDDETLRDRMTKQNIEQVKQLTGSRLHINLLNGKSWRPKNSDREIVERVTKANEIKSGGRNKARLSTTTCVNWLRRFGTSSDLRGVKSYIREIVSAIKPPKSNPEQIKGAKISPPILKSLADYMSFGKGSSTKISKKLDAIALNGGGQAHIREILRETMVLAKKVRKVDSFFRFFDKENASFEVVKSLNRISYLISNLPPHIKEIGFDSDLLPKDRVLVCCTYGRDRTGLATTLNSIDAVEKKLKEEMHTNPKEACEALAMSSSAGHMAGSAMAGFGVAGNIGIKPNNISFLPASRKNILRQMLESSADSNKVEKLPHSTKIKHRIIGKNSELSINEPVLGKTSEEKANRGVKKRNAQSSDNIPSGTSIKGAKAERVSASKTNWREFYK